MAKEMNVHCNFLENDLTCILPEHTMDVLLKVWTRSGEHTFWEDVYTRTLKYRRWNKLRPFHSLKKRVANMFSKRNPFSDTSRGTSMQTIVNNTTEECKTEVMNNDSETDNNRSSVHPNWSKLIPINNGINKDASITKSEVIKGNAQPRKRAIKNIVLVPYKPKPKDWGSWKVKSPYATSTIASPSLNVNQQNQNNEEMVNVLHSPYYSPVHPPEFYGD